MSWRLGLQQRIVALFIGSALVMAGIVGLSLQEFAELQSYSEQERAAEKRSEIIHAVVLVALQTATTFSSLGLDLTADERRYALANGEALLSQLEARQEQIAPIVKNILNTGEQKIVVDAVSEIRRTWEEMKSDMAQDDQGAFSFHVIAVVRHAERLRDVIGIADVAANDNARAAVIAFDQLAEKSRQIILVALFAGLAGLITVGSAVLHFGVRRPFGEAIAAVTRIVRGDVDSPVPTAKSKDEIGSILAALESLRIQAKERRNLAAERLRDATERDVRTGKARSHRRRVSRGRGCGLGRECEGRRGNAPCNGRIDCRGQQYAFSAIIASFGVSRDRQFFRRGASPGWPSRFRSTPRRPRREIPQRWLRAFPAARRVPSRHANVGHKLPAFLRLPPQALERGHDRSDFVHARGAVTGLSKSPLAIRDTAAIASPNGRRTP